MVQVIDIDLNMRNDECLDSQGMVFDGHDCNEEPTALGVHKFVVQVGMGCECEKWEWVGRLSKSIVVDIHAIVMAILSRIVMNV